MKSAASALRQDSGTWHGYLWISHHADGTTIATTNFSDATFQERTCIKGSVAATPDSSGNAILGLNINQAHRTDAPTLTVVPSGAGIQVAVTNYSKHDKGGHFAAWEQPKLLTQDMRDTFTSLRA